MPKLIALTFNHISIFFTFRYNQSLRFLAELGVFRVLIIGVVLALGAKFIVNQAEYLPVITVLLNGFFILQYHFARKDIKFLKTTQPTNYTQLLVLEYAAFSVLFMLFSLFFWPSFIALLHPLFVAVTFLPQLSVSKNTSKKKLLFEFAALESRFWLQKNWFIVLLSQVIAAVFYREIAVQLIVIGIFCITFFSQFKYFEGKELLFAQGETVSSSILQKLKNNTAVFFSALCLPLLLIATSIHLPLVAAASGIVVFCLILEIHFLKYQFYFPGGELDDTVFSVQMGLLLVSCLLPFLLPFGLFLIFRARKQAAINLSQYARSFN